MAKRLNSEEYAKRAFVITTLMAFAYIAAAYFGVINAEVEDVGTEKGFPTEARQQ
jgi:hypothetical protein